MPSPDTAKAIKNALADDWSTTHTAWKAVLHVDDDWAPTAGSPVLLVADDGGPAVWRGPWLLRKTPRRALIRLTAFAAGRDEARQVVDAAVDFVLTNKPGITRVEDVSLPLVTRDRATGAMLASRTVPVIVRQ